MSLSILHSQVEQARERLDALLGQFDHLSPNQQAGALAELEGINKRLEVLCSPDTAGEISEPASVIQARMDAILNSITSLAVIYDEAGQVKITNGFAEEMFGFNPINMMRADLMQRLSVRDANDQIVLPEQMPAARAARGEEVRDVRLEITNAHGRVYSILASAYPVQIEGRLVGSVSVWDDITEHNRTEQALELAHAAMVSERNRLLAVMEALPVGLAIYDMQGGVTQSNHGYDEIWGTPRPETHSVDDYDAYKAWWVESGERVKSEEWASALTLATGKPVIGQYLKIQRFDGAFGYVVNSGAPVYDAQGQIIGGAVAIMDITERVETEEALRESERRFQVALSALPMTVYTMDKSLRYTWIYNPRFGLPTDEVLANRDDIIAMHTTPDLLAAKKSVMESGQGVRREVKTFLNGEWRYYLLSLEPMRDDQGSVIGLIGASLDVTEQRGIELQHRETMTQIEVQRRLMENREKERQEIAREIHDGPIQTLVSNIFNIQMAKETIDHPAMKLELDQIGLSLKTAVRELRDVVNELRPPALLRFGLSRALAIYAEDFREKHREIKLDLACRLPNDGIGLPEETTLTLYRICQESLNNVVRHARAKNVWVRVDEKEGLLTLEIRDNGIGFIVPDDVAAQAAGGHYGLVGMKERVKALGGAMRITSNPGQGTLIEINVPVGAENALEGEYNDGQGKTLTLP